MDAKLKALQFRLKRTDEILSEGERIAVERQKESIATIVSTITTLKGSIEEAKFGQGDTEENVEQWSNEIDARVTEVDKVQNKLLKFLEELNQRAKQRELVQSCEQKMKFEKQLLEQKLEAALKKREISAKTANLPKLNITRFNGKPHDWVRFSGQFNAMVDSQNVSPITKFSHLKELVEPHIMCAIDCLPFTEEGYKRGLKYLEEKYGHPSEVAGSYVASIIEPPSITERDVPKVHRFYEQLLFNLQSLETLEKLDTIQGTVYYVMKKLEAVKAELVSHVQSDWRSWTFKELLEPLRKWTETNDDVKGTSRKTKEDDSTSARALNSREQEIRCIYCNSADHKMNLCHKVVSPNERKQILAKKRLCFNCANGLHAASAGKSKISCQKCNKRHHTSICPEASEKQEEKVLTTSVGKTSVVHPVVVVKINGIKFRALLDSGASHSYVSTTLTRLVKTKAVKSSTRKITTLFGVTTAKLVEYDLPLKSSGGDFTLDAKVTVINKRELLTLDNLRYDKRIQEHQHLQGVVMEDKTPDEHLPVHLVLGANEYAKIRTNAQLRLGRQGESVAELTRFGWVIMAPGDRIDRTNGFLAINSSSDYERLCSLDVLALADSPSGDQRVVYEEFREQLSRHPVEGWYETGVPWKGNHPPLPPNRNGRLQRLHTQVRKLNRMGRLEEYDAIIREQLEQGVVERAPFEVVGKEYYMLHRAVVREEAESTKFRVVYDWSARGGNKGPSLNDCLDPGPPLQNKLWNVMVRRRFHPVAVAGDLRKAFLQVRIKEKERDSLHFHWLKNPNSTEVETLSFTRALFGLAPSPFLLAGVIEHHLESWREELPTTVNEIERSLYVDDLISGGATVSDARDLKQEANKIFADAAFSLRKWHSNVPELMYDNVTEDDGEPSYAQEQLNVPTSGECNLLGLQWEYEKDTLTIFFPEKNAEPTKRGILGKLANVYDPLGLVSPVTLEGKILYRNACDTKQAWDAPLPSTLIKKWEKFEKSLPKNVTVRRSLVIHRKPVLELHVFGDASGRGVCAAIYAVVRQTSGVN